MLGELAAIHLAQSVRDWAGTVQAVAVLIALPLLAFYVWKARQTERTSAQVASAVGDAAEAMRSAAANSERAVQGLLAAQNADNAPYVIAYLDISEEHLVYAVVKNIGRVPASDVVITFDPPIASVTADQQRWDLPAFLAAPIAFLPPQYELRSILGVSFNLFAEGSIVPKTYETQISYTDPRSQERRTDAYALDLGVFRNARSGRSTTLTDIQAILRELDEQQRTLVDEVDALRDLLTDGAASADNPALPLAPADTVQPPPAETPAPAAAPATDEKLADIAELCRRWREQGDRLRWESAGSLQARLRELHKSAAATTGDGVLSDASTCPEAASEAVAAILEHRFYLDGGLSLQSFEAAVDRLLDAAAQAE